MLGLVTMLLLLCGDEDGQPACNKPTGESASSDSDDSFEHKMHEIMEKVMHSKVMEELKALPSEVMEELKALPGELRESLILHVERRSLMVAGWVVAIGAALLLLGCVWIHWCHTEHGEYRYIPVSEVEEFQKYQPPPPGQDKYYHRHSSRSRHKEGKQSTQKTTVTHRKPHSHTNIANGGH